MIHTDVEKLQEVIADSGVSYTKMAKMLGINRSTLYRKMQKNSLTIAEIQKMAEVLNLTGRQATDIFLAQ